MFQPNATGIPATIIVGNLTGIKILVNDPLSPELRVYDMYVGSTFKQTPFDGNENARGDNSYVAAVRLAYRKRYNRDVDLGRIQTQIPADAFPLKRIEESVAAFAANIITNNNVGCMLLTFDVL